MRSGKGLNDFTFGTFTGRFPRDDALSTAVKGSIIITDNVCTALFSGVPRLTALYNILQHFRSFANIIHIIMTTNNV